MINYQFAVIYTRLNVIDSANYHFNQCAFLLTNQPDSLKSFNFYVGLYYIERSYFLQDQMAFHEAISLNQEAIRRHKIKYKLTETPANTYNVLAKTYSALGQHAKADSAYQKAIAGYAGNPLFQAIVIGNLADSKLKQQDAKAARAVLNQATKAYQTHLRQTNQPDVDVERLLRQQTASLFLLENKLPAAKAAFADLLAYSRKQFTMPSAHRVDAHLSLARLHALKGNLTAARQSLEAALREAYGPQARTLEDAVLPKSLLTALIQKAEFWQTAPAATPTTRQNQAQEALTAYEQAIDLVAILRRGVLLPESRQFLAAKAAPLYVPALQLCFELAQQPNSREVYEQRAFALFEKKQNSLLSDNQWEKQVVRQYLPARLQAEYQRQNTRLSQLRLLRENGSATLEAELTKTEQELIAWQARTAQQYPEFTQALRRITQLSKNDYRDQLAPGEILLCYAPTDAGLLVLCLSKSGSAFRRIPVRVEVLNRAINRYRAEISRDPGIVGLYDNRPARQLYQLLLAPLQDQLAKANALTILAPPDWRFPFDALEGPNQRPLVRDYDIAYQFNLSTRLLPSETRPTRYASLALAPFGADTGRTGFRLATGHHLKPLRASAQEATGLGGPFWLGKAATKKRFLAEAPHARLLLLTTHTLAGERETALAFHPTGNDSGSFLLQPSEIQTLDLRAVELASLAACSTEDGEELSGDGVNSLGRAMAWSGAKSVACSFFDVHDEANALVSRFFYPHLTEGMTVRQAFRQARLDFMASPEGRRFDHPFYWSSVAIYGGHNALSNTSPWWQTWAGIVLIVLLGAGGWWLFRQKFPARTSGSVFVSGP